MPYLPSYTSSKGTFNCWKGTPVLACHSPSTNCMRSKSSTSNQEKIPNRNFNMLCHHPQFSKKLSQGSKKKIQIYLSNPKASEGFNFIREIGNSVYPFWRLLMLKGQRAQRVSSATICGIEFYCILIALGKSASTRYFSFSKCCSVSIKCSFTTKYIKVQWPTFYSLSLVCFNIFTKLTWLSAGKEIPVMIYNFLMRLGGKNHLKHPAISWIPPFRKKFHKLSLSHEKVAWLLAK